MFDLKVINSVLDQLEEERGIPKEKVMEAIEMSLATAYKKEYGKKGQIIRCHFDIKTGTTEFEQVKIVVDESTVRMNDDEEVAEDDDRARFDGEKHIYIKDAQLIKSGVALDDEIVFPLDHKDDFGRIAAQTAKQVIIQKIREAEKVSVLQEFDKREGEIVNGTVERVERGNIFINLGRTTGLLPYEEQIPGERYRQGERIRAYLQKVDESPRGIFLRLSRSAPEFLAELFKAESPEISNGTVEIKSIAREAGSRSKIAVFSNDPHVDPVGSCVGQRGVRVSTVMSELGGEKIDIIEWSDNPRLFVEEALSPAKVSEVVVDGDAHTARVSVSEDQQSLAIGRGGQNVRLAVKLTGWKIDIAPVARKHQEEDEVVENVSQETDSSEEETKSEERETE